MIALWESPGDVNVRATNAVRQEMQRAPREALREFDDMLAQAMYPERPDGRGRVRTWPGRECSQKRSILRELWSGGG